MHALRVSSGAERRRQCKGGQITECVADCKAEAGDQGPGLHERRRGEAAKLGAPSLPLPVWWVAAFDMDVLHAGGLGRHLMVLMHAH